MRAGVSKGARFEGSYVVNVIDPAATRGTDFSVPIVATKLSPQPAPAAYVERARLSACLDRALGDDIRLTLVAAPPGYGKTLAVSGWLRARDVPFAWLSLDPRDGDLARFVRYFSAALETVRPGAADRCSALFGPRTAPDPDLVGATLLAAIAESDAPFVAVFDDYHAVEGPAVHALLRFLVEHAPPFCHLVVVSRQDPPLPVAKLRAHGRLLELRAEDLRYSAEEGAAFFERAGSPAQPADVEQLVDLTEGWPAAVQLAALSMRSQTSAGGKVGRAGRRFVIDYLADEVLDRIDADLRAFLVRASVVDRFTAGLCAELSDVRDAGEAAAMLDRAERAQLFLIALDGERRWYRFHQLFAECLRMRLTDAERCELHRRAAEWFERNGLLEDAVAHFLAAGETDRAARAIEAGARQLFLAGRHATLFSWIDALPPERVAQSGELASWLAWSLFDTGQLGPADAVAARRLASIEPSRRGEPEGRLLIVRALLQTVTGPHAEEFAREGLALVGDDALFRSSALQAIGLAQLARGELAQAVACLTDAFELIRHAGPAAAFSGVTPLAQALNSVGRRGEAERICRELYAEYPDPVAHAAMGWYVDVILGLLRLEANDVAEARRFLDRGFAAASRFRAGRTLVEWALRPLALARVADGDSAAALDALAVAAGDVRASGLAIPMPTAETRARVLLASGDIAGADAALVPALTEVENSSPLSAVMRLFALTTEARVRLAQGRPAEAAAALREPEAACRAMGKTEELISVLVLKAAAADAQHRRREALTALREGVRLAAPGGYVRRFVEDGDGVTHLLHLVRAEAPAFVDEVVAATAAHGAPRRPGLIGGDDGAPMETLTARELDVLRLLAGGARNAEVAEALEVSVGTARWHVANILSKLGESSRARAVLRARRLGLV